MENEIKLSFAKRFVMSIKDIDKYNIIGTEKIGRAILYLLKLFLIFALIMAFVLTYKINSMIDEACNYIQENVPNFEIKDKQFTLDSTETVRIENTKYTEYAKIKVIMDNSDDLEKFKQEISEYNGNVIVLLKKNIYIKYSTGSEMTETYEDFETYYHLEDEITKESILNQLEGTGKQNIIINIMLIVFVAELLTNLISTIINILALSLLGIIIAKLLHTNLKYIPILNMSISAITLPTILSLIYLTVQALNGFLMPYFQIMYTLVSYIYLIAAILIIKSEQNKRNQEIVATIKIDTDKKDEEKQKEEKNQKEKNPEEKNPEEKNPEGQEKNKKDEKDNQDNSNTTNNKGNKDSDNKNEKRRKQKDLGKKEDKGKAPIPQENFEEK